MKMLIHSVTKSDVCNNLSTNELSYIINLVLDSLVISSRVDTRANIDDRLYHDRMESYYTDDIINMVIDIINSMIYNTDDDTIDFEKSNYKVTINYLSNVVIILQLISDKKWINKLRKGRV